MILDFSFGGRTENGHEMARLKGSCGQLWPGNGPKPAETQIYIVVSTYKPLYKPWSVNKHLRTTAFPGGRGAACTGGWTAGREVVERVGLAGTGGRRAICCLFGPQGYTPTPVRPRSGGRFSLVFRPLDPGRTGVGVYPGVPHQTESDPNP